MTDALTHRGPDARGTFRDDSVALGHRRLSIQDLSDNAAQPMKSRCGRVVIVYNGECYNNAELRRALGDLPWRSSSDTETLLELYLARGPGFIRSVRGMFALAIYDSRTGVIHLYRDRMGEKPLFYLHRDGLLIFASELKGLLQHPAVPRQIHQGALTDYLLFNYVAGNRSILKGVRKLPPASHFTFSLESGRMEKALYWAVPPPQPDPRHENRKKAIDEFEELLLKVVDGQRVADVPIGCFLSGGIDSSTIAWALARTTPGQARTFTIGFEEADYDESRHAEAVARHLGTEHHCEILTEKAALDLIPDLANLCDEPFADASLLPTALLSRMTRRSVTVALSGDGGDELFLGYNRYRWAESVRRRMRFIPFGIRYNLADKMYIHLPHRWRLMAAGLRYGNESDIYRYVFAGWSEPFVERLLGRRNPFHGHRLGTEAAKDTARHGFLPAMGLMDVRNYLVDDILVKVDRAAMASSLETRVPLLDHRIVRFAHGLPTRWRMEGARQKILLKELLYRHVPRRLMERPKAGFAVPLRRWFCGELKGLLVSELSRDRLSTHGYFRQEAVDWMLREHLDGRANHERMLWALLVFQLWHREFLE